MNTDRKAEGHNKDMLKLDLDGIGPMKPNSDFIVAQWNYCDANCLTRL